MPARAQPGRAARPQLGGEFRGGGDLRQANRIGVAPGAQIDASGSGTGQGGEVIVWSTGDTIYYGDITVAGGDLGGDGGLAEVSGQNLDFSGTVDLAAVDGFERGTLLLDPGTINIVSGSADPAEFDGDQILFDEGDGSGTDTIAIGAETIEAVNGPVILEAEIAINVNASLDLQGDITLRAGETITFNPLVDITTPGSITIQADFDFTNGVVGADGSGDILLAGGTDLSTTGASAGNILLETGSGGNINLGSNSPAARSTSRRM